MRGRRRGTGPDKKQVIEYIKRHDDIFRDVVTKWEKGFEAKLPPEVPLISPEGGRSDSIINY